MLLAAALQRSFVLRAVGIHSAALDAELRSHYRAPLVRWLARTRVLCQAGRARAAAADAPDAAATVWLCVQAPLWVVARVCALLRCAKEVA